MKASFLSTVALTFACAGSASSADLEGGWQGIVIQDNETYGVRMAVAGTRGRIEYADLGCGGTLQLISQAAGVYRYRERITWGRQRCIDGGEVRLSRDSGSSWSWHWRGSGIAVDGVLESADAADLWNR